MIIGGRLLGNVKDLEMNKRINGCPFLGTPLGHACLFTGSELFYNPACCRKLTVMPMIIAHKNVNKLYLVPYN